MTSTEQQTENTPRVSKRCGRKRSQAEIRNRIQAALSKRPMGCHEIAQDQNLHDKSVARHLEYLELIGIVQAYKLGEYQLFRLTK